MVPDVIYSRLICQFCELAKHAGTRGVASEMIRHTRLALYLCNRRRRPNR